MPVLWEQQQDESSRAFFAFSRYRDLGPARSLDRAYRYHIGKEQATAPGTWRKWCTQFAWYRRATAYDMHLDQLRRDSMEHEVVEQRRAVAKQIEISALATLKEVASLAYVKVTDIMTWKDGKLTLKDADQIPDHVAAAIAEVSMSYDKAGRPQLAVKMHSKVRPLELIGTNQGLWDKEKEQQQRTSANSLIELIDLINAGKLDYLVDQLQPSLHNAPPGMLDGEFDR